MSHWSPRFAELARKYGSALVYKVGLEVCGWPPTIDMCAGRVWVPYSEFTTIIKRLKHEH